jgi:hypothetical protein
MVSMTMTETFTTDRYGRPTFYVPSISAPGAFERVAFGVDADNPQREWVLRITSTGYGQRCESFHCVPMTGAIFDPTVGLEAAKAVRSTLDAQLTNAAILVAFLARFAR